MCWHRRPWLLAALALAAASCVSPTLPLPPPSRPDVDWEGADRVYLSGSVPEAGTVFAINDRTDLAAGQRTTGGGSYGFFLEARAGDQVTLFYTSGTRISPRTSFVLSGLEADGGSGGGVAGAPGADGTAGAGAGGAAGAGL